MPLTLQELSPVEKRALASQPTYVTRMVVGITDQFSHAEMSWRVFDVQPTGRGPVRIALSSEQEDVVGGVQEGDIVSGLIGTHQNLGGLEQAYLMTALLEKRTPSVQPRALHSAAYRAG